jgi:PhnB protein
MSSRLNPYISFNGNAREALQYYKDIFGGELTISTFGDFGMAEAGDKVMHGQLTTGDGYWLMGADTPPGMPFTPGNTITISLSGDDEALRGYFEKLADGGSITMPLEKQAWGDEFGQCVDRFGVAWMVNIGQATQQ